MFDLVAFGRTTHETPPRSRLQSRQKTNVGNAVQHSSSATAVSNDGNNNKHNIGT